MGKVKRKEEGGGRYEAGEDGKMAEWIDRQMEVRWLVGGMLYIGIDPQEAPSKIEWHLWCRWLQWPALSSRCRKLWHCQLCWENCSCFWLPLWHRHFLYGFTGRGLKGLVSCRGSYICSLFNKDSKWNEPFIAPKRTCHSHVMSTHTHTKRNARQR